MQPKSIILFFYGYILFFRRQKSEHLLLRNLSIYGLGGMIAPFIGIKIIDIPTAWILRILGV